MPKKLLYDDVKKYIEDRGYFLLSDIYYNSHTKIRLRCDHGHEYMVAFYSFKNGHRCPVCFNEQQRGQYRKLNYDFVKKQISEEGYHLLSNEYINSDTKMTVKCDNNHIYQTSYHNFKLGYRCPYCAGKLTYDIIKDNIESEGYKLLSKVYKNTSSYLVVQCSHGHIYKTTYSNFQRGSRCLQCVVNRRRKEYSVIKKHFDSIGYKLISTVYHNNHSKLIVECDKGHVYEVDYNHFQQGRRCPKCSNSISQREQTLQKWLSNYIMVENNRRFYYDGRKFYEADIYIPSKNIAIEFNGIYYHSELYGTPKDYHLKKTDFFKEQGIQLIHVFENEWLLKEEIVKSIILNKLGLSQNKVYARDCIIHHLSIQDTREFLDVNHLQGYIGSCIRVGLIDKKTNEVVSVMTFNRSRFNNKYKWELSRFCNKKNIVVVGGFSKLLKYINKHFEMNSDIISYADRRYSDGDIYKKNGFKFIGTTKPNYFYFKNNFNIESRIKYQKHKLCNILDNFDPNLTEWENMKNNGYNRIFDSGNMIFILKNTEKKL